MSYNFFFSSKPQTRAVIREESIGDDAAAAAAGWAKWNGKWEWIDERDHYSRWFRKLPRILSHPVSIWRASERASLFRLIVRRTRSVPQIGCVWRSPTGVHWYLCATATFLFLFLIVLLVHEKITKYFRDKSFRHENWKKKNVPSYRLQHFSKTLNLIHFDILLTIKNMQLHFLTRYW